MKWILAFAIVIGLLFPTVASARKIHWANDIWTVRHTYGPSNPGHNIFADGKRSAWVDPQNRLVLNIDKGRAVEVVGSHQQYGTFTWSVDSNLQDLDLWRVVGLFVWVPNSNEQDMEFARWGSPNQPTGWTVGWTRKVRTGYTNFTVTPDAPYRVSLTWVPAFTRYVVVDARGKLLVDVSYPQLSPVLFGKKGFQPRMNNWLWPGAPGVLLTKQHRRSTHPVLRLNSFHFTPLN